ncbi:MAG TPA: tetratricopeptide repeat protein [Bryobacteraceae bacterium]|jgi:tetratricopeptide (TPR) repeat protein|nr:tetratricopeptide repeat protein [Bryobacteraceae bacterium]
MRCIWLLSSLALSIASLSGQTPDNAPQRDLKFTRTPAQKPPDKPAPTISRRYALLIGISKYENLPAAAQLKLADKDAESMFSVLISPEGGHYPAENVHVLLNEHATLANIEHELEVWLPSVTTEDDLVLIYFAGHGFLSQGKGYFAPYDVKPPDFATAYPMDRLGDVAANKIHGRWKVLMTDACHSGAISVDASASDEDRAALTHKMLDLNRSLFTLTASRDREVSYEDPRLGHGLFTYYVIKGLEGEADTSGDGIVTADELAEYVHTQVRQLTGGRQNPTSERGSFDPQMLLAYNPTLVHAKNLPPPKVGTIVVESNMDGVEIWIDGKDVGTVQKGAPLHLPGYLPGVHTVQGVKTGYEPDGPRDAEVYPGQETTVSMRILIPRRRNKDAADLLQRGLEDYTKGRPENYKKAAALFGQALAIDPSYSTAALYLARSDLALYDIDDAKKYAGQAVQIDPAYLEARWAYAGILLDVGDFDEAIRQLVFVTQHDPTMGPAFYLMAEAYRRKGSYDQGAEAGRDAVRINPKSAEAHFWLAECLRMSNRFQEAESEYGNYLSLSNFDSGMAGKLNYYVLGSLIGMGHKKEASQQDIWKQLHGLANFGICDCESNLHRVDAAISYCQTALSFDPDDQITHYRLGDLYTKQYNQSGHPIELLSAARKQFSDVLAINRDSDEGAKARRYLLQIDKAMERLQY